MRSMLGFILTLLIPNARCVTDIGSCSADAAMCDIITASNPFNETMVKFLIWTKSNPGDENYITYKPYSDFSSTGFNPQNLTHVIFHGYTGTGLEPWILEMKSKILAVEGSFVISVDYGELVKKVTTDLDYIPAVCNAYKVANYTAYAFDWLHNKWDLKASEMYVIGHSLGAHVAGLMGHFMTELPIGQIRRITGLDPAGPLFSDEYGNKCRLDKSQAAFVDIIHTNGCDLIPDCLGIKQPIGHVDFFPNGGVHQPGCKNLTCSHHRATELYVESITYQDKFTSWPCDSWEHYKSKLCTECKKGCLSMGFRCKTNLEGTFYLTTNEDAPFARRVQ